MSDSTTLSARFAAPPSPGRIAAPANPDAPGPAAGFLDQLAQTLAATSDPAQPVAAQTAAPTSVATTGPAPIEAAASPQASPNLKSAAAGDGPSPLSVEPKGRPDEDRPRDAKINAVDEAAEASLAAAPNSPSTPMDAVLPAEPAQTTPSQGDLGHDTASPSPQLAAHAQPQASEPASDTPARAPTLQRSSDAAQPTPASTIASIGKPKRGQPDPAKAIDGPMPTSPIASPSAVTPPAAPQAMTGLSVPAAPKTEAAPISEARSAAPRATKAAPAETIDQVSQSLPSASPPQGSPVGATTPPGEPSSHPIQPSLLPQAATPSPPSPSTSPAPPAPPAVQLAQAVVEPVRIMLAAPNNAAEPHVTTIQLQPDDLGRVEIRIERTADGPARIDLAAERPETLLRLVHDQAQLQQALDQAGIPQHGRTINFSLSTDAGTTLPSSSGFAGNGAPNGGGQRQHQRYSNGPGSADTRDDVIGVPAWSRVGIDITA